MSPLAINPELPIDALRTAFAEHGRIQVDSILTDSAAEWLHRAMLEQPAWNLVCRAAGQHRDFNYSEFQDWTDAQRQQLLQLVHADAREGFQYLFASVPIYDAWHRGLLNEHPFAELFAFVNSNAWRSLMASIADIRVPDFADAQASRYAPGHFLSRHDDNVAGKHRVLAYVLNLNPHWQPDWGGNLMFLDQDQQVSDVLVPRWNTLSLFRVPMHHLVTTVAPFAPQDRLAISGWLRQGEDPGPD